MSERMEDRDKESIEWAMTRVGNSDFLKIFTKTWNLHTTRKATEAFNPDEIFWIRCASVGGNRKTKFVMEKAKDVTVQKAAELLGCSRPFLVKLLKEGKIEYTLVGKHRKIKLRDVFKFKQQMKKEQKKYLVDIMNFDKEIGLYNP